MLKNILNPWKIVPILAVIGTLTFLVNDYTNQRGEIKTLTDSTATLNQQIKTLNKQLKTLDQQTKELTQLRYDDSVNYANRELGYQTTIAILTKEIKQLKTLNTNLAAGIMCREQYGFPIKNKVRIVPCNP